MSEFCLIISGAPECYFPVSFTKADFVIACDAGYIHAQRADIVPDVIIGDFDSYLGDLPGGVEIIRTKPEKDDTDTMMALKLAIRRGYRRIMLVGALGGRMRCICLRIFRLLHSLQLRVRIFRSLTVIIRYSLSETERGVCRPAPSAKSFCFRIRYRMHRRYAERCEIPARGRSSHKYFRARREQ